MSRGLRTNLLGGGAVVLVAAGIAAVLVVTRPRNPTKKPPRRLALVWAPRIRPRRNHRVRIVAFGSARAKVRAGISAQVAGEVVFKAAGFLSGLDVRKGQVLFRIDRSDYLLARDSARHNLAQLQARRKRLQQNLENLRASERIERRRMQLADKQLKEARALLARGAAGQNDVDAAEEVALARKAQWQSIVNAIAVTGPDLESLEAEIRLGKVRLDRAELDLARTTVRSPITGRVLRCDVDVGDHVQPGVVCGEVYATDVMEVPVSVPAADLRWLDARDGQAADAGGDGAEPTTAEVVWQQADGGEQHTWRGRVDRIEAGLEPATRTATVVVRVDNPPPGAPGARLELNMFCRVTLEGKVLPEAFVLPREAVLPGGAVYVVRAGKLTRRRVRVARYTNETALILPGGGIVAGERVVLDRPAAPVEGMPVRVRETPPSSRGAATAPARP